MGYKAGDVIKVKTKEREYKGVFIPQKGGSVVLKLDSGYNIGIDKKKIKKISLVKKYKEAKTKEKKIKQNKKLPTISILHTGGTIASRVDYSTGAVVAKFKPEDLVEMLPELKDIANIKSKLICSIFFIISTNRNNRINNPNQFKNFGCLNSHVSQYISQYVVLIQYHKISIS